MSWCLLSLIIVSLKAVKFNDSGLIIVSLKAVKFNDSGDSQSVSSLYFGMSFIGTTNLSCSIIDILLSLKERHDSGDSQSVSSLYFGMSFIGTTNLSCSIIDILLSLKERQIFLANRDLPDLLIPAMPIINPAYY